MGNGDKQLLVWRRGGRAGDGGSYLVAIVSGGRVEGDRCGVAKGEEAKVFMRKGSGGSEEALPRRGG